MKMTLKKWMAWLCCVALLATLLPMSVFAAEGPLSASKFVRNGVLTLTEDTQLSAFGAALKTKGEYTLDLNGHILTGPEAPFVMVGNGVTLTVRDSAGGGELRGIESGVCMIDVQRGGKLVLESGKLAGHTCTTEGGAIYNAGTVEIRGGEISGNTAKMGGAIFVEENTSTLISGGVITDNTATYRGGAIGTAEANLSGESVYPVVEISGGEITGNKTMDKGANLYLHTSRVTVSGGTIGRGLVWNTAKNEFATVEGAGDSWLRGCVINLSGGAVEELTIRPENGNHNTTLTITGAPVVDNLYTTLDIGDSTTVSSVGSLTGRAYVKSSAKLTVAEGDTTVKESGSYIYEASASAPSEEPVLPITNLVMQPGSDMTKRNFTWYSQSGEAGYITYARTADLYNGTFPANAVKVAATRDGDKSLRSGFYNNKATVDNLTPGTSYTYQVSNGGDKSEMYTFRVGEKTEEFSFVFLGDPQLGQPSTPLYRQKDGWDRTLNQLTTDPIFADADFWVSAGDQITANADHATHANMYDALLNNEWIPTVAMSTLVGNHDNGSKGDHYQHFNEPGYIVNPATGKCSCGLEMADAVHRAGYSILGVGEMGIGNTTTSAAVLSVLLHRSLRFWQRRPGIPAGSAHRHCSAASKQKRRRPFPSGCRPGSP